MTYKPPSVFNKEVMWLKIIKWAANLFWCSSDLYLYHQIQEPKIKPKIFCMKIVNGVSN